MSAAVFLDKDGTVVEDVPYNVDPRLMRLLPGVLEGLRELGRAGYRLFIVTNQSGVARGYFPEAKLLQVDATLRRLLGRGAVPLAGFYYCPHALDGTVPEYTKQCDCRKPCPGLLERIAREWDVDLSRSWLIGDIWSDVEAGQRAGCRTVLVPRMPDVIAQAPDRAALYGGRNLVASDLAEAARAILSASREESAGSEVRRAGQL